MLRDVYPLLVHAGDHLREGGRARALGHHVSRAGAKAGIPNVFLLLLLMWVESLISMVPNIMASLISRYRLPIPVLARGRLRDPRHGPVHHPYLLKGDAERSLTEDLLAPRLRHQDVVHLPARVVDQILERHSRGGHLGVDVDSTAGPGGHCYSTFWS